MSSAFSPSVTVLQHHLPSWLQQATATQRDLLQRRIRDSLRARRMAQASLALVEPVDAFCNTRLQQALANWYPGMTLPDPRHATLRIDTPLYDSSWLEAAMQNLDADTRISLYEGQAATVPLALDSQAFVKGVRNLNLGQRYQEHLRDHLDTDVFRQRLSEQDRAAFAAELTLARIKGLIDSRGEMLGEAVVAAGHELTVAPGQRRPVQCSYLSLFGIPLHGPLLVRLQPRGGREPCLLYLPGAAQDALRQYPSLQAMGKALTRKFWDSRYRTFFTRYVSHTLYATYAAKLRDRLFPTYPYSTLHTSTPVLEEGQTIGWLERAFPAPRSVWQQTLDKNARLTWDHTPWNGDVFATRAQQHLLRIFDDAAALAVPLAKHDAAAQRTRIEHWLGLGLTVANIAGLFIPALGAVMMTVGAAQVVETFLDGVHAANEGDADAAVAHLFEVLESLVQFAALGAAASYSEVAGVLQDWHPIEHAGHTRLWNGDVVPFTRTPPWPADAPTGSDGLIHWQAHSGFERDGRAFALARDENGRWRLQASGDHVGRPALQGNAASAPVLEHERPLGWSEHTLLERLNAAPSGLEAGQQTLALRCSGLGEAELRQIVVDHQRPPALLLDTLESYGATRLPPAPDEPVGCQALSQQFPGLSARARSELLLAAPGEDLSRLQRTGRVPLSIAESARYALRQARLSRALAAFHVDNGAQLDRDLLAIAQLQRLPGWSGQIRLELRLERPNGQLLKTTVASDSAVSKCVVRRGVVYQPYDQSGQLLGNDTDVFQAILQALPDSERRLLDLQIHEPQRLRDLLFEQAAANRKACADDLGLAQIRPFLRLPGRLPADPRLGYRLSGRGQGLISEEVLFDELFPGNPRPDRQQLLQTLRQQAGDTPGAFRRLLEGLHSEYRRLDDILEQWVGEPGDLPPAQATQRHAARSTAAQALRQAWRRAPQETGADAQHPALEIDGYSLDRLPALPVPLAHVRSLVLRGLPNAQGNGLGEFLEAFPNLRQLDLAGNALITLPHHVGRLSGLQLLDLAENVLDLEQTDVLDMLTRLTNLQHLNLTDAISSLPVAALERLGQMPRLERLQLDLNFLDLTPEHFDALGRWPALRGLSLGDNDITLTEASRAALARLNRLERLYLNDNPLELAPDLTGWNHLQVLDLQDTQISQWPAGLDALLRQQPLRLHELDLSANDLSAIPALADSAFAAAAREMNEIHYSFDGNPLDQQSLQHLADAGLSARTEQPAAGNWYDEWPEPLREHITRTAADAQWRPLYDLFARLIDTAEYQRHPAFVDRRMRHLLTLLGATEPTLPDQAWGRTDLQRQINDRLEDATQTCVDQAALLFQQTESDVLLWHTAVSADNTVADTGIVVDSAVALLRQQLLDERIGQLYDARLARRQALAAAESDDQRAAAPALHPEDDLEDAILTNPQYLVDEVEMLLEARRRLQMRLALPAQPQDIAFGYLARLSATTLEHVFQAVNRQATAQRFIDWAPQQGAWRLWMRRLHGERFQALEREWEGAADYHSTLNEATAQPGAYTGAAVPERYLQALERDLAQVQWRIDGVVQRVDLLSGRYSDADGIYRRASDLMVQTRTAAEDDLMQRLTSDNARQRLP
ncbi:TPA: DUF6543 domain-containing protein [Pseudomonas putida]